MGRKAGTRGKCLVCGDNACGINYNIPSCMSCKTFFRRNALRQKEAICQFSDCCTLNRITRKFCTKCRLKKCLEVGMNKEMIKSEDENRKLQEKIRLNRIKRLEDSKNLETKNKTLIPVATSTLASNSSPSTSKTLSTETTLVAEESVDSLQLIKESPINSTEMLDSYKIRPTLDDICPHLKDMDPVKLSEIDVIPLESEQQSKSNQLLTSISSNSKSQANLRPNPTNAPNKELAINGDEMLDAYETSSTLDDICPNAKDMSPVELSDIEVIPLNSLDRFDKCPEIGMTKGPESHIREKINFNKPKSVFLAIDRISLISNEHTLNLKMYELSRLKEIYNAALAFPDENSCQIIGQVETVPQMVNLGANNIKHVIRFCKCMAPFNCLTKDDQELVLKWFMPEKTLVRIAFLYNTQTDGWTALAHPNCDRKVLFAKMDFMKSWFDKDLFKIFNNVVIELHREMENDRVILDLILVLLLFKHRQNMRKAELARYYNVLFHYLLRRYLEHKYLDIHRATQKYTTLMRLLCDMDIFNEGTKQFYAKAPISIQFGPAIKEIFNLPKTSIN